jgi:hypothetical protein
MENQNSSGEQQKVQHVQEFNENQASRNIGNNTEEGQREGDELVKGDKGHQQQGNDGSRQGEGGNSGSRGNTGLS